MKRFAWFVLLGILVHVTMAMADTTFVAAGSHVSGEWVAAHSPYFLMGSVTINAGDSLTIGPGVQVKYGGTDNSQFTVIGRLNVQGATDDPVDVDFGRLCGFSTTESTSRLNLSFCTVENAATQGSSGGLEGAFDLNYGVQAVFSDCAILNGTADIGGGLHLRNGSTAVLTRCRISDCTGDKAGAISVSGTCHLTLTDCALEYNTSRNGEGGALLMWSGASQDSTPRIMVEQCQFVGNVSGSGSGNGQGGAVQCNRGVFATFDHCLFFGNRANGQNGVGGAISTMDPLGGYGLVQLTNCTFAANSAYQASAIAVAGTTSRPPHETLVESCIFALNRAGMPASQTIGFSGTVGTSVIEYNDCYANYGRNFPSGFGGHAAINARGDSCDAFRNVSVDPQFVDTVGDCHLTAASHCIDAGNPALPHDPDSTVADIGAYFFDQHPNAGGGRTAVNPRDLSLSSYPNPFNPQTEIRFDLPQSGRVTLRIYDMLGREVETVVDQPVAAGSHTYLWNGANRASGIYFAVLKSGGKQVTHKLLMIK